MGCCKVLMLLSVLALFVVKSSLAVNSCQIPPQFWCDDSQIAKDCGVEEQCRMLYQTPAKPVEVTLYFESLCPDCKEFIHNQLYPSFKKIGSTIMNVTLVPYGNALEKLNGTTWVYTCQHGEQECEGNLLETCAIHLLKDIKIYFPFIHCMEASKEDPIPAAEDCAKSLQLDLGPMMQCASSSLGNFLEHQMALKTDALKPSHEYVPWVTINGKHTEIIQSDAENDLVGLVCKTYTGSPKPSACTKVL